MGRLPYAIAGAIFLLIAGRLFWFPLAVFLVSGTSMAPTAETGDLALGIATYLLDYGLGDVVVWYASLTHGVIHRVEEVGEGFVVTKGDNNPLPDLPVPRELVKYVVVLWIPREAWLPGAAAILAAYGLAKRRELAIALREAGPPRIAAAAFAALIAADCACILLIPVHYSSYRSSLEVPMVELRRIGVAEGGSVAVVELAARGTELVGAEACLVVVGNSSYPCSSSVSESSILVEVPREAWLECYERADSRASSIYVVLNSTFDKGWVYGRYRVAVEWRELEVSAANSSLVVYNPNYVPFELSARAAYYEVGRFGPRLAGVVRLGNFTVGPTSSLEIPVEPRGDYAYVEVWYEFRFAEGGVVREVKKVVLGD